MERTDPPRQTSSAKTFGYPNPWSSSPFWDNPLVRIFAGMLVISSFGMVCGTISGLLLGVIICCTSWQPSLVMLPVFAFFGFGYGTLCAAVVSPVCGIITSVCAATIGSFAPRPKEAFDRAMWTSLRAGAAALILGAIVATLFVSVWNQYYSPFVLAFDTPFMNFEPTDITGTWGCILGVIFGFVAGTIFGAVYGALKGVRMQRSPAHLSQL